MRKLMVSALVLASLTGCGLSPASTGLKASQSTQTIDALKKNANSLVTFAETTLKSVDKDGDRTITFTEYMSAVDTGNSEYGGIATLLYMTTWGGLHALSRQTFFTMSDDTDPKAILAQMKGQSFAIKDLSKALTSDFFLNSLKATLGGTFAEQDRNKNSFLEATELSADDWKELAPFDANKDGKIAVAEYVDASLTVISQDKSTPPAVRLGQISLLATTKEKN